MMDFKQPRGLQQRIFRVFSRFDEENQPSGFLIIEETDSFINQPSKGTP